MHNTHDKLVILQNQNFEIREKKEKFSFICFSIDLHVFGGYPYFLLKNILVFFTSIASISNKLKLILKVYTYKKGYFYCKNIISY
jgi:hypothetical protein